MCVCTIFILAKLGETIHIPSGSKGIYSVFDSGTMSVRMQWAINSRTPSEQLLKLSG